MESFEDEVTPMPELRPEGERGTQCDIDREAMRALALRVTAVEERCGKIEDTSLPDVRQLAAKAILVADSARRRLRALVRAIASLDGDKKL